MDDFWKEFWAFVAFMLLVGVLACSASTLVRLMEALNGSPFSNPVQAILFIMGFVISAIIAVVGVMSLEEQ